MGTEHNSMTKEVREILLSIVSKKEKEGLLTRILKKLFKK